MKCTHCAICAVSAKCTKSRHVCQIRSFIEREATKDIKPARWKIGVRK